MFALGAEQAHGYLHLVISVESSLGAYDKHRGRPQDTPSTIFQSQVMSTLRCAPGC